MSYASEYLPTEPTRDAVDAATGLTLLEFGAPDCGFCVAIQPAIRSSLDARDITHLKIEDGAGRPLGRSFGVRLWPTLVLMRDGQEVGRLVRPGNAREIGALLEQG